MARATFRTFRATTRYRDYQKLKSKEEDDRRQEEKKPKRERADYRNETRRKMTYKEKMEFERLEKEMGELEQERSNWRLPSGNALHRRTDGEEQAVARGQGVD